MSGASVGLTCSECTILEFEMRFGRSTLPSDSFERVSPTPTPDEHTPPFHSQQPTARHWFWSKVNLRHVAKLSPCRHFVTPVPRDVPGGVPSAPFAVHKMQSRIRRQANLAERVASASAMAMAIAAFTPWSKTCSAICAWRDCPVHLGFSTRSHRDDR